MRRISGAVLIGIGVFGVVLAVLLPTVVVHGSKRIPLNLNITLHSTDPAAKMLDATTGSVRTVALRATRFVQTDSKASNGTDTTVNETVCVVIVQGPTPDCFAGQRPQDANRDPRLVSTTTDRVTTNRRNAQSVAPQASWGPELINGQTTMNNVAVKHVGVAYAFPIDTKKTTYKFFQPDLNAAYDATYVGSSKLKGLTVYEFVCKTGDQPYTINGTFAGTYNDTRTVWVEPKTGAIIKGSEHQIQTLQGGTVALDSTLTFDDAAQNYQAHFAKTKIAALQLAQVWGPLICAILGIAALVGGAFLLKQRRGPAESDDDTDERPDATVPPGAVPPGTETPPVPVTTQAGDRHRLPYREGSPREAGTTGPTRR
ncbi:MAG TPA: DUF3068 domain-containing protein [Jatrophihabitantaceae bacterium]|nr:DUF3068 domain-containing protein [Jatrophihabitantaceae bacterium]